MKTIPNSVRLIENATVALIQCPSCPAVFSTIALKRMRQRCPECKEKVV